jgi:hypothetical protein
MDPSHLRPATETESAGARAKLLTTMSDLKKKMRNYGWIRLIIALWASRMALAAVSYGLPALVAVYQEINAKFAEERRPLQHVDWDGSGEALYGAEDQSFPKVSALNSISVSSCLLYNVHCFSFYRLLEMLPWGRLNI